MSSQPLDGDGQAFVSWGKGSQPESPAPMQPQTASPARHGGRQLWLVVALVLGGAVAAIVVLTVGSGGGTPNGVAAMQPAAIVAAARSAITSASSVRVTGSGEANGQPVQLDLTLVSGQGAVGTVTEYGASFQLIAFAGAVYMKGSAAAWGRTPANTLGGQLLGGKWLQLNENGQFSSMTSFADGPALFAKFLGLEGTLVKGPTTSVDGQSVVEVQDPASGAAVYVAATGTPYPVEIAKSGPQGGSFVFDRIDQPVVISAPANAVNISQFEGSG
jgi:hypothetical protein